jgi:membrane-associated protein
MMLHADVLISDFVTQYGLLTYLIVFVIIFLETGLVVTNFFPGDSLLFASGILASSGDLHLWPLIGLLFVATVIGNTSNYMIGRFLGGHYFKKENKKRMRYFNKASTFYEKYGIKSVMVSRFIPFMRSFIPFFSGTTKMKFWSFTLANAIGGILWVAFYILLGYYIGEIPWIQANLGLIFFTMMVFMVIVAILFIIKIMWKKKLTL